MKASSMRKRVAYFRVIFGELGPYAEVVKKKGQLIVRQGTYKVTGDQHIPEQSWPAHSYQDAMFDFMSHVKDFEDWAIETGKGKDEFEEMKQPRRDQLDAEG